MIPLRFLPAITLLLMPSLAFASFRDVPADHPNADAIAYVEAQGIVTGYADGTYRPEQTINRAEFTKIIIAANFPSSEFAYCTPGKTYHFPDVETDAWYASFLCIAVKYHINGGYPDGTFRPAANVNFAEAAKMIVNGQEKEGDAGPLLSGDQWFTPFVKFLDFEHAIPLSITRLDQSITRGEMAEMIYRLKTENREKPSRTYEELAHVVSDTMTVKVFLQKDNPSGICPDGGANCYELYVSDTATVPKTTAPLRAALEALFNIVPLGDNGCYVSDCSLRTHLYLTKLKVTSATIVDGIAHVKLDGELGFAGDLSPVYAIEQIERTVRQFPSVKSTDITVNGSPLRCLSDESGLCH